MKKKMKGYEYFRKALCVCVCIYINAVNRLKNF